MQRMIKIEKITSRDNRRLLDARKIRDGKIKERIFIEGRRLVSEALRSEIRIEQCFVDEGFAGVDLLEKVASRGTPIFELTDAFIKSIADTGQSQGIILIAQRPSFGTEAFDMQNTPGSLPLLIFLKEINNPSNLGAIMRTAEAAGAAGVIVSRGSADAYSPKSLRSAMGAAFRLPVWQEAVTSDVIAWARKGGLKSVAADISGTDLYTEIDWSQPRLLIFGSEAHGLRKSELETLDTAIRIPMENDVESLNLAVSAGILLFEAKRQNTCRSK